VFCFTKEIRPDSPRLFTCHADARASCLDSGTLTCKPILHLIIVSAAVSSTTVRQIPLNLDVDRGPLWLFARGWLYFRWNLYFCLVHLRAGCLKLIEKGHVTQLGAVPMNYANNRFNFLISRLIKRQL
jgi:hypothetical protein